MAPRVNKKRKSSDEENLDLTAKCRNCDKTFPMCQTFQCSRNRQHYACVDCLRIAAEEIVFENGNNYDHERKGINCYRNKCTGIFPYDEVKIHLIPEMAAALNAVMTVFNCAVCFLDHSMKDGISCQKVKETNEDNESHTFCFECIKEFAATDEAALAYGGVGLGCMQTGCEHALMLNQIRNRLSATVIKRLEDRVMEENIGHAEIEGLQRCQKCNYAVEVIGGRYFVCVCGHKQCNICGEPFDNKHSNFTCQKKKNKENLTLDDQINSVVVRFCHKCNLQFVKSSGCNFMRCRCGATQCYICREQNIAENHFCKCPGLLEECKCTKRCRQFADANHIDAHRIELLKNQMKAGNKISNEEILKAMPDRNIPEYEDSDDDDDDEDDDMENDSDNDGNDSMDENQISGNHIAIRTLRDLFARAREAEPPVVTPPSRNELPGRLITVRSVAEPRPHPHLIDLDPRERLERVARRIRRRPLAGNQPPIRGHIRFTSSSEELELDGAENRPSSSNHVPARAVLSYRPNLPSAPLPQRLLSSEDSSDENYVVPISRNAVERALNLSSSSEDSSDEEHPLPKIVPAAAPSMLSSSSSSSEDSSDEEIPSPRGVSRNDTIVLDSSEEEDIVLETSDEEDGVVEDSLDEFEIESDNGTVQLDSSDEEEVIGNAVVEVVDDSDEDMFESANEDSTQSPTVPVSEEDDSDSDVPAIINARPRIVTVSSSDDSLDDSSENEIEYASSD